MDEDGAHAEIERLTALQRSKKPLYSDRFLSHRTPGTENLDASQDAQLTHDDLLAAQRELAELHGVSSARVRGMVMLATVQSGLGYSEAEQADVIREVALSLQAGDDAVSGEQILALSGRRDDDTAGLAAMVPDAEHLMAAAVLARSGHGDWAGAGELIAERARELGVPDPLDSGAVRASAHTMQLAISMAAGAGIPGDEIAVPGSPQEAEVIRLTNEHADILGLARGSGGRDTVDAVVARHPELSHLFRAGKTSSRRHPARSGRKVGTRTRAHASDLDEDARDSRAPARGGVTHPEVERLLREHGVGGSYSSNSSDGGPSPYRSPGRSGKPQSR